ncbi:uncharacterized protein BCR38DRAFT_410540 [Pseudomassariella vexata]|uniref:Uncharacterized protein n=1 Tax=Pseudomassariella vexata TaxID=1141098 RepID=A0A1Y2DS35_9PEZI|nr:uncharacterized protein BCR38DRAFT_410540 [Pseudomassariella vexata]ORY62091.1 hypothetical protein BCR38DRAFT_410540 [Pseudomassariella vexata]
MKYSRKNEDPAPQNRKSFSTSQRLLDDLNEDFSNDGCSPEETTSVDKTDQESAKFLDQSQAAAEDSTSLSNPENQGTEPKRVSVKNERHYLVLFFVFHLPSMTITFILSGIYLVGYQWTADSGQINALLFAAKLHDALMIASLSNILFHRIRHNLLITRGYSTRGILFGLLIAPFQVTNPLFLIGRPFVASIKYAFASPTELTTNLLVIIVFILAALSAPCSSIVLLPRYNWWPLPENHQLPSYSDQSTAAYWILALRSSSYFLFTSTRQCLQIISGTKADPHAEHSPLSFAICSVD